MSSQVRQAPPIRLLLLVAALALVLGSVLWTVPRTADTLAVSRSSERSGYLGR